MNDLFPHYLRPVSAAHLAIALVLMLVPEIRGCRKPKRETIIPVEFVVEVPEDPDIVPREAIREAPAKPQADPPKPVPRETVKPRERPKVQVSSKVVTRQTGAPRKKTLTAEQIQKLLDMGAKPGAYTSVLTDDQMNYELIRRRLYQAWVQPGAEEAGDADAMVALRLGPTGRVLEWRFARNSGNELFDDSVSRAMESVREIAGLTASFLGAQREVTVAFKLGEEE